MLLISCPKLNIKSYRITFSKQDALKKEPSISLFFYIISPVSL